jgi:hypothetical protein
MQNKDYLMMNEYDKIRFGFPISDNTFEKINDVENVKVKNYKKYFNN